MSSLDKMLRIPRKAEAQEITDEILNQSPGIHHTLAAALPIWIRRIRKRRSRLTRTMLIKFTTKMLKSCGPSSSDARERRLFRDKLFYGARILHHHGDATSVVDMLTRLHPHDVGELSDLRSVHDAAKQRLRDRVTSAIYSPDYARDIDGVIQYLSTCTGYRVVKVRFDAKPDGIDKLDATIAAKREISAYTDGDIIHLSPWLASTASHDLNQGMLTLFLVVHEYLHMAAGSYEFSFKSNPGRLLYRKLRPRRATLKQNSSGDAITHQLRAKLESEGINVDALSLKKSPDLIRLVQTLRQLPLPALRGCKTLSKTGGSRMLIQKFWPGVYKLHQAHEETYARDVVRSPHAETPQENLLSAIGMMAAGRPVVARIDVEHRDVFMKARKLVETAPRNNVYDSATLMMKIYDLIEDHLGEEELEQIGKGGGFKPNVSMEEVVVRYRLAHDGDTDAHYRKDGEPESDLSFEPKQTGLWLEEFDGTTHRPRTTHVTVRPFVASNPYPALPPLDRPLPEPILQRVRRPSDVDRRWHPDGPHLATDRLAEYTAAHRAGQDMSIHYDQYEDKPPLRWTLVFDLSISMEAPRHALGGQTPIQQAIQFGTWFAAALESQGVEVHAYGAVSGGPKLCKLFRLPTPVSESIAILRCEGAGGCRHGAFIRAIAANAPELEMTKPMGDHNLTILTDGDPSYISVGRESIFATLHHTNCQACSSRHRCKIEGARGAINGRPNVLHQLFHPLGYSLTDTAEAITSAQPKMQTQLLLLGGSTNAQQYDHFLGRNYWQKSHVEFGSSLTGTDRTREFAR